MTSPINYKNCLMNRSYSSQPLKQKLSRKAK